MSIAEDFQWEQEDDNRGSKSIERETESGPSGKYFRLKIELSATTPADWISYIKQQKEKEKLDSSFVFS